MTDGGRNRDTVVDEAKIESTLYDTLSFARERDYIGWDYADGMSSAVLQSVPADNKWFNLVVQETIKRAPVNLRPLMLVKQRRNFKGAALFSMANLTACNIATSTNIVEPDVESAVFKQDARQLANWLVENSLDEYEGFCGSHQHVLQELDGKRYPSEGDIVSTSYAVKALTRAASLNSTYRSLAETASDFVLENLDFEPADVGARIKYVVTDDGDVDVPNAIAIGARLFVDLYDATSDEHYLDHATDLLNFVASRQDPSGGWEYKDPPSESRLSMDNHHNGFIIECFQRYREVTGTREYEDVLSKALSFYRETLYEHNGAPNWDETDAYPRDIHAVSQGILVFTYAGEHEFARRILRWALNNLYGGDGRFYFRKHRFYTKRITLMRWCQAWMAYAMSEHLAASREL